MMYQGGKTRIAKPIAEILKAAPGTTYVEPFVGSAATFHLVAPSFQRAIAADAMPDLALLWTDVLNGWTPPESLSREEYDALRHAEPSALRAFAGFPCSFGGKWFGGYARDPKSDRNYARTASRSILRRAEGMRGAEILQADYRELSPLIGPGVVVYCDPPYADTTGYAGPGAFDSAEFWRTAERWARSGASVFVSEYTAPAGWREVWATERHVSTALNNRAAKATDRLFVFDPKEPAK
ncbi:DNA methylase [Arthrobacter phage Warda]|nr:DNA methylase [Arthrobacter phage Warda]